MWKAYHNFLVKKTNKQTIQEPAWYKDKYESSMRSLNSDYKRFVDQCSITESLSILVASKSNNNHGVSQKPFLIVIKTVNGLSQKVTFDHIVWLFIPDGNFHSGVKTSVATESSPEKYYCQYLGQVALNTVNLILV